MSHSTITLRRSKRSMITPPTVPSRKPGSTRVVITRLTAAPELSETRAAMARIAMSPIQSPEARDELRDPEPEEGLGAEDAPRRVGDRRLRRVGRDERRLALRLLVGHPRLRPGSGARSGRRGRLPRRPLGGRLLCRRLLRGRLLRGRLLRRAPSWRSPSSPSPSSSPGRGRRARRAGRPPPSSVTASGCDAARHGGVGGAVGDVRTEATVEHAHRRADSRGADRARRAAASPPDRAAASAGRRSPPPPAASP